MAAEASIGSQALEPEAFKALYPDLYYQRFVENGIRPDGRPFGATRPVTIGPNAVGTADASALVKLGSTTVLAGVKLEVLVPTEAETREGQLVTNVELTPMCSNDTRPGRTSDVAICCAEQVRQLLNSSSAVDLSKLAIPSGNTAWVAYLDLYVLDADGCLLDACLLGAVSALASLKALPSTTICENGQVVDPEENGDEAMLEGGGSAIGLIKKKCIPLATTCGLYKDKLITDPSAEEERLMDTLLTIALDGSGRMIGLHMPGGKAEVGSMQLQECVAAAKLRYAEVRELLEAALDGAA